MPWKLRNTSGHQNVYFLSSNTSNINTKKIVLKDSPQWNLRHKPDTVLSADIIMSPESNVLRTSLPVYSGELLLSTVTKIQFGRRDGVHCAV